MNNKLQQLKDGFIKHQFELIDAVLDKQKNLNLNDKKESTIYWLLESSILSIVFRLKGIIHIIKELYGEEIEVPEKYQKLYRVARETLYFKENDLVLSISDGQKEEEIKIDDLLEKIKISKNGQQGERK